MDEKTALLIIDAQVNMFAEGAAVYRGERILRTLADLIARARASGAPVIYVQNNGTEIDPDYPGTPGWEIHPVLAPRQGDYVIQKRTPNAFHETDLQSGLEARGVRRLVIAGMQTDFCIDASARAARDLGYAVTLVKDAHSTYDGGSLTAAQIIDQYNADLSAVVKLEEAASVRF